MLFVLLLLLKFMKTLQRLGFALLILIFSTIAQAQGIKIQDPCASGYLRLGQNNSGISVILPSGVSYGTPEELPLLADYTVMQARNINNEGEITGSASRASGEPTQQAVIWTKSDGVYVVTALPPLSPYVRSSAYGFAYEGMPVGYSFTSGVLTTSANVWKTDLTPVALELLPAYISSQAVGGNGVGLASGSASNTGVPVGPLTLLNAMVWYVAPDGTNTACDLGVPPTYYRTQATDVSTTGIVVGTLTGPPGDTYCTGTYSIHTIVWRPTSAAPCNYSATILPCINGYGVSTTSPGVNDAGDVVVRANGSGVPSSAAAYYHWNGTSYDAPTLLPSSTTPNFPKVYPRMLLSNRVIVGTGQYPVSGATTAQQVAVWYRPNFEPQILANPAGVAVVTGEWMNIFGDLVLDTTTGYGATSGAWFYKNLCTRFSTDW